MPPTCDSGAQLFACLAGWLDVFFFLFRKLRHTRPPWFTFPPSSSTLAINLLKFCSEIYGRQSHSITMSIFFLLFVFFSVLASFSPSLSLCLALSFVFVVCSPLIFLGTLMIDCLSQEVLLFLSSSSSFSQMLFWFLFSFMQLRTIVWWYIERQSRRKKPSNTECIPFLSRKHFEKLRA